VPQTSSILTTRQLVFKELFIGTLIYVVVLGLFDDLTSIVDADRFGTILLTSVVLEVLTFLVLRAKDAIVAWLRDRPGPGYRVLLVFCLWLVMFLSKFVFLGVIDLFFSDDIYIRGFFGILAVVVSVTLLAKLSDLAFSWLGANR
jgi:hypothetical protein